MKRETENKTETERKEKKWKNRYGRKQIEKIDMDEENRMEINETERKNTDWETLHALTLGKYFL